MSELKTYNKYLLNGSSLIESVIAITIIATCLLIAIRLYAAILNSSDSLSSYKMKFQVAQLYNQTVMNQNFDNEVFEYERFSIRKNVKSFQGSKDLKNVKFIVQTVSDTIIYNYLLLNKNKNE